MSAQSIFVVTEDTPTGPVDDFKTRVLGTFDSLELACHFLGDHVPRYNRNDFHLMVVRYEPKETDALFAEVGGGDRRYNVLRCEHNNGSSTDPDNDEVRLRYPWRHTSGTVADIKQLFAELLSDTKEHT